MNANDLEKYYQSQLEKQQEHLKKIPELSGQILELKAQLEDIITKPNKK